MRIDKDIACSPDSVDIRLSESNLVSYLCDAFRRGDARANTGMRNHQSVDSAVIARKWRALPVSAPINNEWLAAIFISMLSASLPAGNNHLSRNINCSTNWRVDASRPVGIG